MFFKCILSVLFELFVMNTNMLNFSSKLNTPAFRWLDWMLFCAFTPSVGCFVLVDELVLFPIFKDHHSKSLKQHF